VDRTLNTVRDKVRDTVADHALCVTSTPTSCHVWYMWTAFFGVETVTTVATHVYDSVAKSLSRGFG
jgi:hypothetical protein